MRNSVRLWIGLIFLLCGLGQTDVSAKVLLPQIISSNMVLQRDKPVNIWGFAEAGEPISVNFAGQTKHTTADKNGHWKVVLAPLKASNSAQTMRIVGSNRIMLTNILVGEVWICSGQSNMEYAMRKLVKLQKPANEKLGFPQNEVATAQNNNIRLFLVNRKLLNKPDSIHKSWSAARDSALRAFSAVGYFYAKELQQQLGVPIGMIESAVSGSAIEPWVDITALDKEPYFRDKQLSNDPGKFFTTMIEPLAPFAIKGFLWYQGETNCFLNETISYTYKMKTLINNWRETWHDPMLPFYYVQIAPFNYSKSKGKVDLDEQTEPRFWEAQAQLMNMPNTGMVVTTDLNDKGDELHPTYKWQVGKRLALWALAKTYGQKLEYSGPVYQRMKIVGKHIELTFSHAEGLASFADTGFLIAGNDGNFHDANFSIEGNRVMVSSKDVPMPKHVMFNWTETPSPALFNRSGLPALPFRTNNPLTKLFKITNASK